MRLTDVESSRIRGSFSDSQRKMLSCWFTLQDTAKDVLLLQTTGHCCRRCSAATEYGAIVKMLSYWFRLQDNAKDAVLLSHTTGQCYKTLFYFYRLQGNAKDAVLLLQTTGQCQGCCSTATDYRTMLKTLFDFYRLWPGQSWEYYSAVHSRQCLNSHVFWQTYLTQMPESVQAPFPHLDLLELCHLSS